MKKSNWSGLALMCVVSLMALFVGPLSGQSLDEIIETRPEVTQPVVTPGSDAPAVSTGVSTGVTTEATTDLDAMRRKIVELAGSMVGTVVDKRGDDGNKIGWQNLKKFYEVAYKINDLEKERSWWMADIKGVGKKVNDWCGIFCIWAWRSAGLPVHWNTKVIGCKYRGQKNLLAPGDIVIMKNKNPEKPLNHHCIIKSINGDNAETIDGNQGIDSIMFRNRKVSDIEIFYSVAEAMGTKPQAQPGSQIQNPSTSKPGAGQSTPAASKPSSSGSGKPKPATASTGSGKPQPATADKPEQLTQEDIDTLIKQVMMLIKVTLGQFF